MNSIKDYENLIKNLPVRRQRSRISKASSERWNKFFDDKDVDIGNFNRLNTGYTLTRQDILDEQNPKKRIVKTLIWGYPYGGRGNNILNTLKKLGGLISILDIKEKNISKKELNKIVKEFANIGGLGISTWSKLLYFFEFSVEGSKCQIFDKRIEDSLNAVGFKELQEICELKQHDKDSFFRYITCLNRIAKELDVDADKIELFLFEFNLNYSL